MDYFSLFAPAVLVDRVIADWFRAHLTPATADLFLALSGPGSAPCVASLVLLTVLCLIYRRSWQRLLTFLITVPLGALLTEAIKLAVARARPFADGPFGQWGGYSFPSGHTTSATLIYLALTLLVFSKVRGKWRWPIAASAALLVACVALSRVALGAHFLTDVSAGILLGAAWAAACHIGVRTILPKRQPAPALA